MRQGSGPDISDFQSRVSAAEASVHDAVFTSIGQFDEDEPLHTPSLAPHGDGFATPRDVALEPYNPGMLPGTTRTISPSEDPRLSNRFDRYDALFKPTPPLPQREDAATAGNPSSGQSLRERLLARAPGSSLIKR